MKTLKLFALTAVLLLSALAVKSQGVVLCVSANPYYQNSQLSYHFFDSTLTNGWTITGYHWDFGDGQTSTQQSPYHTYSHPGNYTVCQIVSAYYNGNICHDTACITVSSCAGMVVATFTYQQNGATFSFTGSGSSNYPPLSFSWTFGDGTYGTGATPTHTYTAGGVYQVCLKVTDANGCFNTYCQSVSVTTVNQCGGAQASFTSSVSGNTISVTAGANIPTGFYYQWWLDGTATGVAPTYSQYSWSNLSPGYHQICLYIYATPNIFCDSVCHYVNVPSSTPCGNVQASFTATNSNPGVVVLQSTSAGTGLSLMYEWWMDGQIISAPNPNTAFTANNILQGAHTFCLYVYSGGNQIFCDSACQTIVVNNSTPCPGLNAQWTQTYVTNNGVHFISANSNSSAVYHWDFGDGTTSSQASPTHYFPAGGLYNVCLIVNIPGTICADTSCHQIQANTGTPCNGFGASITVTPNNNGLNGWYLTANPVNGTANASYSSLWSNGSTTNSTYVTTAGVYCVTITDYYGCTASACDTIHPVCNISAAFQYAVHPTWVSFYPYSNTSAVFHHWVFGDGTISSDSAAWFTHAYPANPNTITYQVCHYVYNSNYCIDTVCQYVVVPGTSNTCGTAALNYYLVNNTIHAYSTSTGVDSTTMYQWYVWNANNVLVQSQSSSTNYIVTQGLANGTYTVCLFLYSSNQNFCDSACVSVTIGNTIPCTLSAAFQSTVQGNVATFYSANNTGVVYHNWNFGDGTTSTTSASPLAHQYPSNPNTVTYHVCHYVYSTSNCIDSFCTYVVIPGSGSNCHAYFTYQSTLTGNYVYFTGSGTTNTGTVVSWSWSFGDGSGSTQQNPVHQYNVAGNYIVCLSITTSSGCSNTYCDTVTVGSNTNCTALFSYTHVSCFNVQFANASTGNNLSYQWYFGDGTSSNLANPLHTFPVGTWTVQLTVYNNTTGCQNSYYQIIHIQPCTNGADTLCGIVFEDLNGNGVQDNGEPGLANQTIHIGNYTVTTNNSGHYSVVVPDGSYYIYYCIDSAHIGYNFSIPFNGNGNGINTACAYYQIQISGNQTLCGFNFGIVNNSVHICGTVYYDANNNHLHENSENGIPNVHVTATDANNHVYHAYTDQNGDYCFLLPAGIYVITISNTIGGTVTPQSITVNATTIGASYNHNDFGIYVQPGACNLSIELTPHTTITPGFPAWYHIIVCNIGASVASGTVNMFYDPAVTFDYASPVQTSINTGTHTITWDVNNLMPGDCEYYWVHFDAIQNLTVGQNVFSMAVVNPGNGCNDVDFTDNVDTVHQQVTASWDPNNKIVMPMGEGVEGKIDGSQELTYTINFQNTGNAPAVNVVLRDVLDNNLDLETFHMIGASHPYVIQFSGNEVIWKFSAIMLPDSGTDEQHSHGFVTFGISPLVGLAQGTQIHNTANIYFDYNAAVPTNTTLNTIDYTLGIEEETIANITITLMPNPFSDFTTVKIDGGNGKYELRVFDMLGNIVKSDITTDNIFTINRNNIASGVYMYEVRNNNGNVIGKGKLVAQ